MSDCFSRGLACNSRHECNRRGCQRKATGFDPVDHDAVRAIRQRPTIDQLWDRSRHACADMLRYGNTVADENILAVLEALADLNDNVANGRAKKIVQDDVDKIKALLDVVAREAR